MGRVFFFERPKSNINVDHAATFGEVVYIFGEGRRRCSAFNVDLFQRTLTKELMDREYDPLNDYVCVAGSMLVIAIGLVAVSRVFSDFKVLLFSSTESGYVERLFKEDFLCTPTTKTY